MSKLSLYKNLSLFFISSIHVQYELDLKKIIYKGYIFRKNVNVVIPGQFNVPFRPNGVTQCKKDSSTGKK